MTPRPRYTDLLNKPATSTAALQQRLDVLTAALAQAQAQLTQQVNLAATSLTAVANNSTLLSASVGDTQATVAVLEDAFVDNSTTPPTAVARWGLNLNAGGVVTSMQAIAQNDPAGPVSQIRFNADLQSENFVAGDAGWEIKGNGDIECNSIIIRNGQFYNVLPPPSLSPAGGMFATTLDLTVASANATDVIRYTSDGMPVTKSSPEWPVALGVYTTLTITKTTMIAARAWDVSGNSSGERFETYVENTAILPQAATPGIFGPHGGSGACGIVCATAGASIFYSKNGGAPGPYTIPVAVVHYDTIEAYATMAGYVDSNTAWYQNLLDGEPPP